jgi:hypothetical protein
MTTSIVFVLTLIGIFCLLLTTTIILLTLAAAYYYYMEATVNDLNVPPTSTSNVVPPMAIALPPVTKTAVDLSLLVRKRTYQTPTMPKIFEETIQDILWAAAEIPAHQQMRKPVVLLTATNRSGTSDASGDAYMVMSGEPPTMPVILEETEEDLLRENFRVTPLTGKHRHPAMPVIPEESEKELEWENFHLYASHCEAPASCNACHPSLRRQRRT